MYDIKYEICKLPPYVVIYVEFSLHFKHTTWNSQHNGNDLRKKTSFVCVGVGGGECRVGDLRICELAYIKNSLVKLKRANKQDFKEKF